MPHARSHPDSNRALSALAAAVLLTAPLGIAESGQAGVSQGSTSQGQQSQGGQGQSEAQPAPTPPPAPTCADAEKSHQFDFWIGEWDVFAKDRQAGVNSIQPILDGCVLQEKWRGAGGSAGSSLNFYNPQTGKWHQFWVWRNGTTLDLSGGIVDGEMVLTGNSLSREGKEVLNRITWTPNPDGSVRQHWQVSADGGKTWTTSFDGLYKKKS